MTASSQASSSAASAVRLYAEPLKTATAMRNAAAFSAGSASGRVPGRSAPGEPGAGLGADEGAAVVEELDPGEFALLVAGEVVGEPRGLAGAQFVEAEGAHDVLVGGEGAGLVEGALGFAAQQGAQVAVEDLGR
ncbi:hypothetical protein [Streptomyces somaliensis]|uniref:hypothetical protein n=1 Tax=Streptomyces somaliensis TaxID=78355 RepID=UPI0034E97906|nr:hypothetical protein [Streptomyces somaliensis]